LSTAEIAAEKEVRILLIGETLAAESIRKDCRGVVEKLRMGVDIVAARSPSVTSVTSE
jgi:hypothetical protein